MKIYISKYRDHWISPYTVLDYMFFWTDWSKCNRSDEYIPDEQYINRPAWTEKWSDRLTPISQGIQKFLDLVHPRVEYVKIDYWDTWSMDSTLSPIILPMLKQLKATKQGSPMSDDEDVPEHLRSTAPGARDGCEEWDSDNRIHDRWEWIMDEMIWAFEQLGKDNHTAQFWEVLPEIDFTDYPEDQGKTVKPVRWKTEGKCDWEGLKAHEERISNGTRLFGKYYRGLWD